MMRSFEVEIRSAEQVGYEPQLVGTMIQEGRASTGGRAEVFAPNSIEWPAQGVAVLLEHRGQPETRGQVVRQRDGRLTLVARATDRIRAAVAAGKKFLSVEFRSLKERTTRAGIREVSRAFVDACALTARPEYDHAIAEVRSARRRRFPTWL